MDSKQKQSKSIKIHENLSINWQQGRETLKLIAEHSKESITTAHWIRFSYNYLANTAVINYMLRLWSRTTRGREEVTFPVTKYLNDLGKQIKRPIISLFSWKKITLNQWFLFHSQASAISTHLHYITQLSSNYYIFLSVKAKSGLCIILLPNEVQHPC